MIYGYAAVTGRWWSRATRRRTATAMAANYWAVANNYVQAHPRRARAGR